MQAIPSIGNAAMEVTCHRSPFRALVWKEWRQQRWIFLSMAGLAYALLILSRFISSDERGGLPWRNILPCFAGLIGIIGVVVLSANAFSGEREDNTEQFLDTIPCSRGKLFRVKLGFVLSLVLLELIPLGAAALIMQLKVSLGDFMVGAGLTAAGVLVCATVPALVASFGGSVIATTLASMPVVAACWAYMYLQAVLAEFLHIKSETGKDRFTALFTILIFATILLAAWRTWARVERTWRKSLRTAAATAGLLIAYIALPLAVAYLYAIFFAPHSFFAALYAVLMLAAILLAAWRMWVRAERTWRSSLRTAAATAGLLIAYVAVPVMAAYLYVTLFAPLSFFMDRSHGIAFGQFSSTSPDGKHVIFYAHYNGWGSYGLRSALTDVDSGRTQWLTRFREGFVWPTSRFWSPSGSQFVVVEADRWLWPLARQESRHTYFLVDARSGEKRSFNEICPGLPQLPSDIMPLVGWYGEQVFAFQNGRDIFFADIEHHEVRQCKMPAALPRSLSKNCRLTRMIECVRP